jgi:hypothetical protein
MNHPNATAPTPAAPPLLWPRRPPLLQLQARRYSGPAALPARAAAARHATAPASLPRLLRPCRPPCSGCTRAAALAMQPSPARAAAARHTATGFPCPCSRRRPPAQIRSCAAAAALLHVRATADLHLLPALASASAGHDHCSGELDCSERRRRRILTSGSLPKFTKKT